MAVAINDLAKKACKRLSEEGATLAGISGMLGNIMGESGMQSYIVEYLCLKRLKENGKNYTQETYYKAVDSGKISRAEFLNPLPKFVYGFGCCQWTTPDRKAGLYDKTVKVGKSIADEDIQVEYLIYELKNSYKSVWKILTTTSSVKTASDTVLRDFESPNNWSSMSSQRASYSQEYYDYFKKNGIVETKGSDVMAQYEITGNYISNSGSDENGRATGGIPGDQTKKEWQIRSWYNRPWDCILRHPDEKVRHKISELAIKAAQNDHIGYNQNNRYSYWEYLVKAGYDPSKIVTNCDADCSAGVIANTKAAGYILGIKALQQLQATYTGNMRSTFKNAGFQVLTGSKYLTSADYLLPGDILLNDAHHTATCVSTGSKAKDNQSTPTSTQNLIGDCTINAHWFLKDAVHPEIKSIQILLNEKGYRGKDGKKLDVDGELGPNTAYAIEQLQRKAGMPSTTNWGTVAGKTWQLILN